MAEIVLVAAVAANGVIGRDNGLVFRHGADAKHFRDTTMGAPVVMGRKTWESLPARFRPLPGRRNIVVTRQPGYAAEGAETAAGLDAALALAQGAPRVFVIGGGELYAQALPHARELVLTEVQAALEGDVRFPPVDPAQWIEVQRVQPALDVPATPAFSFVTYRRR
ncbi:MAG: dihydrofolate reductase [Burkholderiaceae bacterium]|nr:dihydrofolate reductase [Burkholderiaceae bacterium]MCZ8175811.1 dihydrofolate reductase [Burkholderiaceae bacterium]